LFVLFRRGTLREKRTASTAAASIARQAKMSAEEASHQAAARCLTAGVGGRRSGQLEQRLYNKKKVSAHGGKSAATC